jgi:hypothetical protein
VTLVVRRAFRRVAAPTCALLLLVAANGCRQGAQGFGDSPAGARQAADDFLGSIAQRFTDVYRAPKFAAARPRLGRYALTPSKIERDTSVWTSIDADGTRTLNLAGYFNGSRYVFNPSRDWPVPTRVGQSRHMIQLHPKGDGEYQWRTDVHQVLGTMPADALSNAFGGFFTGLELVPEGALLADSRFAFPRATAALGRLFAVDSLHAVPHRDGGKSVTLVIRIDPKGVETEFPAFATYLKKYVGPARYDLTLREPAGMRWLHATADDDRLVLRFRVHGGSLQPFDGPPRTMPEAMRLDADLFARVMIFEVGASSLRAEATRIRSAREDGWRLTFQQEPQWHLPLATKHLIRAPLRRPFEQGGSTLWLSLRADNGSTYLSRGFRSTVKESAILRWIGLLGWTAMSDFSGPSEVEENRFIAEAFGAMRADSRALPGVAATAAP